MRTQPTIQEMEAREDIFYGQIVFIVARWFVIAGAVFLSLWRAESIADIQRHIIPLAFLIAANFFLHARYVMGLPANALLLKLASALDLAVITSIILVVTPQGARGIENPFFVFYYPVVLAFALVFPRAQTLAFSSVVALTYTAVCLLSGAGIRFNGDEEVLAMRLVTLLGTAFLGTMYWRLQRARRRGEIA